MPVKRIIVEGADQQGKTSVCNKLAEVLGWNVIKFGPPSSSFNFHSDYLVDQYTICDRNFVSELVYSRVRGESHKVVNPGLLQFTMRSEDYFLIVLDRGSDYVFQDREEMYSKEDIAKARKYYAETFMSLNILPKMFVKPDIAVDLFIKNHFYADYKKPKLRG